MNEDEDNNRNEDEDNNRNKDEDNNMNEDEDNNKNEDEGGSLEHLGVGGGAELVLVPLGAEHGEAVVAEVPGDGRPGLPVSRAGPRPRPGPGGCRTLEGPKYCRVVSYLKEIQIVL